MTPYDNLMPDLEPWDRYDTASVIILLLAVVGFGTTIKFIYENFIR